MFVKIEPSGVCERKGLVQVRLAMYLESTDYGYAKHHVTVPVIPAEGYKGALDKNGRPDPIEYTAWLKGLPTTTQDNPFHNHFIQVSPTTTDAEIMDIAEAYLHEAGVKWGTDKKPDLVNPPLIITAASKVACDARVAQLKALTAKRTV